MSITRTVICHDKRIRWCDGKTRYSVEFEAPPREEPEGD